MTSDKSMSDRPRIPQLDGMRGFAFLLVFIAHLQLPPGFSDVHPWLERIKELGWIGVPLFFVLSGYLITELALREGEDFSLLRFYARRMLRLWPLYFTAAILAIAMWNLSVLREIGVATSPNWAVSLFTFTLNFAARARSAALGSLGFLIVFWTLAVEEQFYALWAPVLRWCPRRATLFAALAIVVISLIVRFAAKFTGPFLIYRMQTLIDFGPIMLGCALALLGMGRFSFGPLASNVFLTALLLAACPIAYCEWPFPTDTVRSGMLLTVVDFYCLLLLFLALCGTGLLRRFFEWRPMRALGDLSYAGYVIHFGLFIFYYRAVKWRAPALAIASPIASVALDAAIVFGFTLLFARGWLALEVPFRHARARLSLKSPRAPRLESAYDTNLRGH
jgi:peptidoglycan/LPS O-acetylase OafA/YrhL